MIDKERIIEAQEKYNLNKVKVERRKCLFSLRTGKVRFK